jgi:hypothetical protein
MYELQWAKMHAKGAKELYVPKKRSHWPRDAILFVVSCTGLVPGE